MKRMSSLVIIGVLCLSMFPIFAPNVRADSLYTDFESGLGGWEPFTQAGGSLVQLSTMYAHSGIYSVEQMGRSSGSEPMSSVGGIRFPVSSTLDRYELSAWVYVTERSDANAASLFGFAYGNEFVAWNPWGSSSSYVYVRLSEGYQMKGDWYNPVPYGLTLSTWHQVNVTAYTNLGTVSIWLDGSLIVEQWPAFNVGETPTYYDIECSANYYGTHVMHQYVDDVYVSEVARLPATIAYSPGALNLKSKGDSVACYIELPKGYNVTDINATTISLNNTIPVESGPTVIGDYNNNSIPDLMVEFNRTELVNLMVSENITLANVTLSLTGNLNNGIQFEGSSIIPVSALMGDVNCDGKVNLQDLLLLACAYKSCLGDCNWNPNANFACPWGVICLSDLVTIGVYYGQHY